MKANLRACSAFIAGCLIAKKNFSSIFEQTESTCRKMRGKFEAGNIDVIDLEQDCKIVGMAVGDKVSFFHAGENLTVCLQFNGTLFTGVDVGTNKNINGSFHDSSVKLYDYDDGINYFYTLAD